MGICVYCKNETDRYNVCDNCIPYDMEVGKKLRYQNWRDRIRKAAEINGVTEKEFIIALKLIHYPHSPNSIPGDDIQSFLGWAEMDDMLEKTLKDIGIPT